MKIQLSRQRNALLYAQLMLSLCSLLSLLKSSSISFRLEKEASLAMMRVSLVVSKLMICQRRFTIQLQKYYEYSWKKKTSAYNLARLSTIFLTFLSSLRKLSQKKGLIILRQTYGSLFRAQSIASILYTYFSRVWQAMKSQSLVVSLSFSWHSKFVFLHSDWKTSYHFVQNSVLLRNLPFYMPVYALNMGEYRPILIFRSTFPISHLNFSLTKPGKYLGKRALKMLLMSFSWISYSSQQNSKGLFIIPQQLSVATVMVLLSRSVPGMVASPEFTQPIPFDYKTVRITSDVRVQRGEVLQINSESKRSLINEINEMKPLHFLWTIRKNIGNRFVGSY